MCGLLQQRGERGAEAGGHCLDPVGACPTRVQLSEQRMLQKVLLLPFKWPGLYQGVQVHSGRV
jgi:hypothetical protein